MVNKFLNSTWGIILVTTAISLISFYTLTNYRVTAVENEQVDIKRDFKSYNENVNEKLTLLLTKVANIEGKLSK